MAATIMKCTKEQLPALLAEIAEIAPLYLPTEETKGHASYKRYSDGTVYSDALNTVRSPKDLFFPQTEDLVKFKTEGKNIEIIDPRTPGEDFVVFGVRACDVQGLVVLDRVFLADPVDSYYADRREHGILISMACKKPAETCFCAAFGIDAGLPAGDIRCTATDDSYIFEALTEKGNALLFKLKSLTTAENSDAEAAKEAADNLRKRLQKLPLADLPVGSFGPGKTAQYFDDPRWATLSESCLGCGSCTFVCPTCQCYDIRDFNTGNGVLRYRCWDSCMYSDFTLMSAGQPRLTQKERFRQRFMHKLVYYPENNDGMFSCVGCGRCLQKCPVSLHIAKVIRMIAKEGSKDE